MKHLIALALAAMLVFACAGCALAQTCDLFPVGGKVMLTLTTDRESLSVACSEAVGELGVSRAIVRADGVAPCVISVAKSDMADGQSLADLGEEGLEALKALAAEQFDNPEIVTGTADGVTYIAVKSYGDEGSIHTIFTLVGGYFVQTTQYHEDFSALTQEDGSFAYEVIAGLGSRPLE